MATVFPSALRSVDPSSGSQGRHLYGPAVDFFLLGGLSFVLLPLVLLLPSRLTGVVAFTTLALAWVINHPHFAHSYQLFYDGFIGKLSGPSRSLRIRYALAGIAVPLVLGAFFALGVFSGDVRLVAAGGNIMALFVGWHYVKQGYGMLMVDAALKRRFFSEPEKRALLANAYAVWAATWLFLNNGGAETNLFGLRYYAIPIPHWLFYTGAMLAAVTGYSVARVLRRKIQNGGQLPFNGLVAYGVTLYLWIVFASIHPIWLLVVPALHSLQYLAVVYRFQSSREKARAGKHLARFTLFVVSGFILGGLMFAAVPQWVDGRVLSTDALFGPTLFLFIAWISINVHHYFMDSVMWRRDNPAVKAHLFS